MKSALYVRSSTASPSNPDLSRADLLPVTCFFLADGWVRKHWLLHRAGGRPSPRFTAGKLEAATSGELRAAFLPSGDFSRTLLNSDSFGRRGSLGLTGLGAESPIASSVPMPASALQKAHFEVRTWSSSCQAT